MVARSNRKDGGAFFGCVRYPHCQYTRRIWSRDEEQADSTMTDESEEVKVEKAVQFVRSMVSQGANIETALAAIGHALSPTQMSELMQRVGTFR